MGKTFARVHICIAGDFHGMEEKFKQWTEANGGKHSKEMDAGVTHLITTKHEVRKGNQKVKVAKRMNKVKIVSASWLEDSLVTRNRLPKPEGPYLLVESRKKGKGKKKVKGKQAETKTCESPEKKAPQKNTTRVQDIIAEMEADGYHIYKDDSEFTYYVKLARPSLTPNRKQRYSMMLFESNTTPKTYVSFVAYTTVGKTGEHYLTPSGSPWEPAIKSFRNFFKQRTGKKWEDRDDAKVTPPKKDVHGEVLPEDEGWFTYEAPMGDGKQVTSIPASSEPAIGNEDAVPEGVDEFASCSQAKGDVGYTDGNVPNSVPNNI